MNKKNTITLLTICSILCCIAGGIYLSCFDNKTITDSSENLIASLDESTKNPAQSENNEDKSFSDMEASSDTEVSSDTKTSPDSGASLDSNTSPNPEQAQDSDSTPVSDASLDSVSSPNSGSSLDSVSSPNSGSSLDSVSSPVSGSSLDSASSPNSDTSLLSEASNPAERTNVNFYSPGRFFKLYPGTDFSEIIGCIANVDKNETVFLRRIPSKNAYLNGRLHLNDFVEIISYKKKWFKVKRGKVSGYVYKDFIKLAKAG